MMQFVRLFWNYQHKGLNDWLAQRISALMISIYTLIILMYGLSFPGLEQWRTLLFHPIMKVIGGVSTFGVLWHAKIGLWVIITDYLPRGWLSRFATLLVYIYVWFVFIAYCWIVWGDL